MLELADCEIVPVNEGSEIRHSHEKIFIDFKLKMVDLRWQPSIYVHQDINFKLND